MAGGSELQVLKIVLESGGEVSAQLVSKKMGVDTHYARLMLKSLARADYVDKMPSGKYRITAVGKRELHDKGFTGRSS